MYKKYMQIHQIENAHTNTDEKLSTHLKNVLNMLVMPEFSAAAGGAAVRGVRELDGDEAGDGSEEEE
jgi:hypothetical protein